jgi:hypothetical protein
MEYNLVSNGTGMNAKVFALAWDNSGNLYAGGDSLMLAAARPYNYMPNGIVQPQPGQQWELE